jgi:hypothetical protein
MATSWDFKFLGGVHQYPEQIPKIDFYHYKSRLANKAMVAELRTGMKTKTDSHTLPWF